jgi:hypothetical protein
MKSFLFLAALACASNALAGSRVDGLDTYYTGCHFLTQNSYQKDLVDHHETYSIKYMRGVIDRSDLAFPVKAEAVFFTPETGNGEQSSYSGFLYKNNDGKFVGLIKGMYTQVMPVNKSTVFVRSSPARNGFQTFEVMICR